MASITGLDSWQGWVACDAIPHEPPYRAHHGDYAVSAGDFSCWPIVA